MNDFTKEEFIQTNTLLVIQEVLRMIGVSRRTLYKMIRDDQFPKPYKITSSRIAWKQKQIIEWFDNLKHGEYKSVD